MLQIEFMIRNNKTTLYVDFQHLKEVDYELAEAIQLEYYRFEPYLRYSLYLTVSSIDQNYAYDIEKGQK